MKISEAKQIILGKIGYILITGFIFAMIAAGYKYCFTPSSAYKGTFQYTRIIQIVNDGQLLADGKKAPDSFNYTGIINTNGCYVEFFEAAEKAYDFAKINSSWNELNTQDKINWFRGLIRYGNFRDDTYEIIFNMSPNSIKDLSYLNENISGLIDLFVKQGNHFINKIKPGTEIKTDGGTILMPKKVTNDKKTIALRYAVYGFIAGIFLSIAVFIGIPLIKRIQE